MSDCGDEGDPGIELTAMSFWEVTAFSADSITFSIEIMNTTDGEGRITSFGVEVLNPDTDSATGTVAVNNTGSLIDPPEWDASLDTTFPTFGMIDLVIIEDSTGEAGIFFNQTDSLILTISGFDASLLTAGLTLSVFPIKYAGVATGVTGDSFESAGTLKTPPPTMEMPEPGTLVLFGIGLLGLGALGRRRRRVA